MAEQDDYPVAEGALARLLTTASNKWRGQPSYDLIGVKRANRTATGRGETVAILDTAVRVAHPVFGWMWKTGNDGRRFAGGGWVKPIDLVGGPVGLDEGAHGTFVAGMVAGVAPGAKILPVRVADAQGEASAFTLAQGILAATARKVDVINISLGTSEVTPRVLKDAIDYAQNKGILVVTSAGNDNSSAPHYPSAFAFSVGATTLKDKRASFSNFGTSVDIAAPGVSVYGPIVWGGKAKMAAWSGTSFSAGITSGVAALAAQSENAKGERLEKILERTAKDLARSTGLTGRVDAAAAVGAR